MKGIALVSLLSVALAHPTGLWWGTDVCYTSPENTDNQCSPAQQVGFDWSELGNGDNWSYDGFNFVGFSAKNGCQGPDSDDNCIGGELNRDDGYTLEVNTNDTPFSIRTFHLSTSRDTNVLITYEMPSGPSCHQIAFSSRQGVDVHNDQCGGATNIKFTLPEESKFGDCTLDIHSISFDCSAGTKHPDHPVSSSSEYQPEPTTSVPTAPVPVHEHHTTTVVVVSESPSTPEPMSTVWATTEITIIKCGPTVTDCPAHSTITSTLTTSTTTCPIKTTEMSAAHPSLPSAPPSAISTSAATTPAPCPELVPKCLNTWLSIPKCSSNSDAACFCPSSQFTDKVQSCIKAWGSSKQEVDSGLSYFAGICAPYVPNNPAIIDMVPTPSPTAGPATKTPCTTITWSSHTVTVPQVGFNTVTGSSTTSVCLTAGTPASAPVASPSETVHKEHSKSTTTPCSTHTSTFFTTIPPKPTETHPTTTKPAPEPTETVVHANAGMKPVISGSWAFGVVLLVLAIN